MLTCTRRWVYGLILIYYFTAKFFVEREVVDDSLATCPNTPIYGFVTELYLYFNLLLEWGVYLVYLFTLGAMSVRIAGRP